ncbi:uncharacterized protein LOC117261867 [Epinephelus lanceolatus]
MPTNSQVKRKRLREAKVKRRARAAESDGARVARRARDLVSNSRARDEETRKKRAERLQVSMGGRNCCVINCRRRSHDHLGRKIPNGLTFHCFPAWRTHEGKQVSQLTKRRREAWVDAVGRSDITFHHISSSIRVCSRHFHSGKPAYEMLVSDPDWVPSLHLGHNEGTSRRPERLLQSVEKDKDQNKKSTKTKDQNQRRRKRPLQSVQEDGEQNQRRPAEMSPSHETESEAAEGKPAYDMLASDPDWVPSLHLGHNEGTSRRPEDKDQNKKSTKTKDQNQRCRKRPLQSVQEDGEQNQRLPAEMSPSHETESAAAGGEERPAIRPWREVKSLLQSALQRQTNFNKQPVKKTDPCFRDFFRDALEASLEASSRSRALSARQPSSEKFSVELSFKLPPVKEAKRTCEESFSSSSFCENCVKLQSRIMELQEKLSHLTGEQEDSFVFNKAPVQLEQELQSPETAHTEEIYPEWMEPLSSIPEGEDDPGMGSSKCKRRRRVTRRFQKAWLKMFWFLRYSSTLDQMWCHVCRLHSDKSMKGKGLIRGSRVFKFHNIRNHSLSQYHKANVSRHMLYMCNLQM